MLAQDGQNPHDAQEEEAPRAARLDAALRKRMARPQRHRLLQGYPMAPLLAPAPPGFEPFRDIFVDHARPLLVGVLPHTFCNPRVRGCGFCTFPHEKLDQGLLRRVVDQVVGEIERTAAAVPRLRERRIPAIYFGGGTANLTPPGELARLCAALEGSFDTAGAEVTLEGVPRYFLLRDEALLDVLAAMKVRHRRISMGVQSFDPAWIQRMGREAFGDRAAIGKAVEAAHRRGFTVSADLLFNLPGAMTALTLEDMRIAMDLGFDQICVYNLVLTEDLGTEWAHDRSLLHRMPDTRRASATWLEVREALLRGGYEQTTLTNFERADLPPERRFVYERASFEPHAHDAVGFGPGGISTFTDPAHRTARKWMNEATSADYVARRAEHGTAAARLFDYSEIDLRLLHVTRGLSKLAVDTEAYSAFFRSSVHDDFAEHLDVLEQAGLLRHGLRDVQLTPEGMFFADAVAGLLSEERVRAIRPGMERLPVRDVMG
jgi:coproporphyrinogen III oxidase-like Fe-S oxidoreductase